MGTFKSCELKSEHSSSTSQPIAVSLRNGKLCKNHSMRWTLPWSLLFGSGAVGDGVVHLEIGLRPCLVLLRGQRCPGGVCGGPIHRGMGHARHRSLLGGNGEAKTGSHWSGGHGTLLCPHWDNLLHGILLLRYLHG